MKNIDRSKSIKATLASIAMLAAISFFMVTVTFPYGGKAYAQSSLENGKSDEPTLKDLYKLLKEIQTKIERREKEERVAQEVNGPATGIKVTDWSLYVAWGVPTIHRLTIENASDTTYRDIRIRASYYYSYSTEFGRSGTGKVEGVLPITLLPHTKKTFKEGVVLLKQGSMASMYGGAKDIEIVGATPAEDEKELDLFTSK